MPDERDELLKPSEAARMLRVSVKTIQRWARLGQIRAVTLPSGHIRVPRDAVDELLRTGRRPEND